MQLETRNRPTLILPEEIAAYGPWAGQLDTESLGKAPDKTSITIDHERLSDDTSVYTKKRFFVRIRSGEKDFRFNTKVAALEKALFPVITITLANSSPGKIDKADFGALLKFSEFATVIAGYLMGINPVNQPGVEAYKKAQGAYLKEGAPPEDDKYVVADGAIKLDYSSSMGSNKISEAELNEALARTGNRKASAIYAALMNIAAKKYKKDYAVMMIFKRLSLHPALAGAMDMWRESVRARLHIDTLGEEAPCILHAKQQGFQDGEKSGFFTIVRFAEYGKEKIAIPGSRERYGSEKTFEDLAKAQAAGTLAALSAAGQLGVMIELEDTSESAVAEFAAFIKD